MKNKIVQFDEKFRKVSKSDLIIFIKTIMNDKNLFLGCIGGTMTILSATYSKSLKFQKYSPMSNEEFRKVRTLVVKLNFVFNKQAREYYEFNLVRDSKNNVVYHCSMCKIEYLKDKK